MKKIVLLLILVASLFAYPDPDNLQKGDKYHILATGIEVKGDDYAITTGSILIYSRVPGKYYREDLENGDRRVSFHFSDWATKGQLMFWNVKKWNGFDPYRPCYFVDLVYEGEQIHEVEMKSGEIKKLKMKTFTVQLVTDKIPEDMEKEQNEREEEYNKKMKKN